MIICIAVYIANEIVKLFRYYNMILKQYLAET